MSNGFSTSEVTTARIEESALANKGERYRFQEQCFLHFWKTHIFQKLMAQKRHPLNLIFSTEPGEPQAEIKATKCPDDVKPASHAGKVERCEPLFTYNHINSVISENPAALAGQFNKLDGADQFFNLDSSILTQLKPEIELYKIYPTTQDTKNSKNNQPNTSPETIRHKIQMPLGENIYADEEGMPSRAGISSLEDLFYDQGVLGNVMMTDLSFQFAGKTAALLNTVESVRFTLSFSSFNLFNHEFETIIGEEGEDSLVWSYKDLISYSNRNLRKKSYTAIDSPTLTDVSCYESGDKFIQDSMNFDLSEAPNKDFFEIQMAIRYNPDDIDWDMVTTAAYGTDSDYSTRVDAKGKKISNESQESLKTFLRNSAILLRLQFVAHTIKYNAKSSGADPELLIDFEYKAFIESSLNTPELDIFKLIGQETKLIDAENKLSQARRLLEAVQRENLTLGAIFGQGGAQDVDASDGRLSANEQYSDLRDWLSKPGSGAAGELSWLIWSPSLIRQPGGLANIIPTKAELDKADSERRAPSPTSARQHAQVRKGLHRDQDLESVLNDSAKAVRVFEELVNKIRNYLRSLRRHTIGEKYKNIFTYLWQLEKVYSLSVGQVEQQLGFAAGKVAAEKTVAKKRRDILKNPNPRAFEPKNIRVVIPATGAWKGGGEHDQNLEDMSKAFQETHMSPAKINEYKQKDKKNPNQNIVKTLAQRQQDILGAPTLSQPADFNADTAKVYFTTLGDILDVAITIASAPNYGIFDRGIGYLLGPLLEHDFTSTILGATNKKALFNLAWVPISLKALAGFFAKKVMASTRERYLLGDFIRDIIQDLILPSLGSRCIDDALEGNQEIGVMTFTTKMKKYSPAIAGEPSETWKDRFVPPLYPARRVGNEPKTGYDQYPPGGSHTYEVHPELPYIWDPISPPITTGQAIDWNRVITLTDLTSVAPNTPIKEQFNYMFIYVNNYIPTRLDPTKEDENRNNGIHYLHLGKIPSIARGATFTKENQDYVREARVMGQLTRTGGIALKDVYRFSCSMYGNNIFKPGMLFFVDPTKDGSANYEEWRDLGIGGFYRVVRVDHAINAGGDPSHVTSLNAVWETFGSCDPQSEDWGLIDKKYVNIYFETLKAHGGANEANQVVGSEQMRLLAAAEEGF